MTGSTVAGAAARGRGGRASRRHPAVAVVGCGHWGQNLVRNFEELGALSLVCDLSAAGRRAAARLAPRAAVVEDISAVLAADVPAVVIATPAATHYALARRVLAAGKDVFVEKPLALTYGEGHELVRLARARRCILMVGHVLEYHPAIISLVKLVQQGRLGRVLYIYSNRLSLGRVRREENILWSFAPHDVAIVLRLMGGLPSQVIACGGAYVQPDIADVTVTHLLFDNGVRSHIHVSWLHPFKEQRLVVIGTRRMASFDAVAGRLVLHDQRVTVKEGEPVPIARQGRDVSFAPDEPLKQECLAFLSSLVTRRPPLADGVSGLRVLRVLEAAQHSLVMNGTPVRLARA